MQKYGDELFGGTASYYSLYKKIDDHGEKKGWNSTAFETYDAWTNRNGIQKIDHSRQEAKDYLIAHFEDKCNENAMKKIIKILQ